MLIVLDAVKSVGKDSVNTEAAYINPAHVCAVVATEVGSLRGLGLSKIELTGGGPVYVKGKPVEIAAKINALTGESVPV